VCGESEVHAFHGLRGGRRLAPRCTQALDPAGGALCEEPVLRAMDEHVSECNLGDNAATSNASACFSVQLVQMTWAFQGSANSIISCGCY
jgi:hypothetical protein